MILWTFIILMTLACVLAIVFYALKAKDIDSSQDNSDQALYASQKQALQTDFENGKISQKALAIAETELARHFIQSNKTAKTFSGLSSLQQKLVLGVGILFIPLISFGLYAYLGSPEYKDLPLAARQNVPIKEQSIEQLVASAEARIAQNPNDLRGWKVIAPIYRRLGRIDDAAYAYQTIMAAEPKSANPIAELAEIRFIEAGRIVSAEAMQLFKRAAELDPNFIKPRFYLALAAFQQGDKEKALEKFNEILEISPPDAPWGPVVKQYTDAIKNGTLETAGQATNTDKAPSNMSNDAPNKPASNDIRQNKQVLGMVEGLAERLQDDPDDIEGWLRLIRSYKVLGKTAEYEKAIVDAKTQYKDKSDELAQIEQLIQSLKK